MEASGSIAATTRPRTTVFLVDQFPWWRALLTAITISSALLLFAFSGLVALRRFWGGLQLAPGLLTLVAVGFLLAVLSSVVHCGTQLLCDKKSTVYRVIQGFLPLSLVLAVFSICLPGSSFFAVLLVIVILGSEELFSLVRPAFLHDFTRSHSPSRYSSPDGTIPVEKRLAATNHFVGEFPAEVIRRIERTRGPLGEDVCWGQIRSEFLPDQRTAAIHLEFCPPFQKTPVLHVEQVEGPDATVKTTQILPYGARLEVRLARSGSDSLETRIEFSAIVENSDGA